MKMTPMTPMTPGGKALYEHLKKELALPEDCTWVEVRFEVGAVVKVSCSYMPSEPDHTESRAPPP